MDVSERIQGHHGWEIPRLDPQHLFRVLQGFQVISKYSELVGLMASLIFSTLQSHYIFATMSRFSRVQKKFVPICWTHSDIHAAPPSGRQPAARAGRWRAERSAHSDHLQCCVCTHTSHGPGRERDRKREREREGVSLVTGSEMDKSARVVGREGQSGPRDGTSYDENQIGGGDVSSCSFGFYKFLFREIPSLLLTLVSVTSDLPLVPSHSHPS